MALIMRITWVVLASLCLEKVVGENTKDNSTCTSMPPEKETENVVLKFLESYAGNLGRCLMWWLLVGTLTGLTFAGLLCCCQSKFPCSRSKKKASSEEVAGEDSKHSWFTWALTSYFGIVYLLYIFTVPAFGKPSGWMYPNSPHFGPAAKSDGRVKAAGKVLLNGMAIMFFPFGVCILVLIVMALLCVILVTVFLIIFLSVLARSADAIYIRNRDKALGSKESNGDDGRENDNAALAQAAAGAAVPAVAVAVAVAVPLFAIQ